MDLKIFRKRMISILILFILYFLFAIYLLFFENQMSSHLVLLYTGLFILMMLSVVATTVLKETKIMVTSVLLSAYFAFELILNILGKTEMDLFKVFTLDIFYHFGFLILCFFYVFNIFLLVGKLEKRNLIYRFAYENNRSLYAVYRPHQQQVEIEFTDGFIKRHQLQEKTKTYDLATFYTFLSEKDKEKFINLGLSYEEEQALELKIQFPMIDQPISFLIAITKKYSNYIWLGFDVTNLEMIKEQLRVAEKSIKEITKETIKVVDYTKEIIVVFDTKGNVVEASKNYLRTFNLTEKEVIGKHVNEIGIKNMEDYRSWFQKALTEKISFATTEYTDNSKPLVISWRNVLLEDEHQQPYRILSIGEDITEKIQLTTLLEQRAHYDSVTHLLNRFGLEEKLHDMPKTKQAAVFVINIDNLHEIDDYYGNEFTNKLLVLITKPYQQLLLDTDLMAMFTRKQYVLIFFNRTEEEVLQIKETLETYFIRSYLVEETHVQVKLSMGLAQHLVSESTLIETIQNASIAATHEQETLYLSVVLYEPKMKAELERNLLISNHLFNAIENDEINVYFQKIVDGQTQAVVYVETLARWKSPTLGNIPPNHFIEIARKSNLIEMLEAQLVVKSLQQFSLLKQDPYYKETKLTLNLTPEMFLDIQFIEHINTHVELNDLHQKDIVIEVSEQTFIHNLATCQERILQYRHQGYLIAIDDFGSQYSSLMVLGDVSYDMIKIDKQFIQNISQGHHLNIVKFIWQLGKDLGKTIIAEGVETEDASQKLIELGITVHQGFYYHVPEPLTTLLMKTKKEA